MPCSGLCLPPNHFSKRRARTQRPKKLKLIPEEGKVSPAKVDQLLNNSSIVASNFKFENHKTAIDANKSSFSFRYSSFNNSLPHPMSPID